MIIKETIERECCSTKDLKKIEGFSKTNGIEIYFCIHCGRRHIEGKEMGPAGGMDYVLIEENPWPIEEIPKY